MKRSLTNSISAATGPRAVGAALIFALLAALFLTACSGSPAQGSGAKQPAAATADPAVPQGGGEWVQYVPSGTGSSVETPYEIPADKAESYTVHTVVFGPGAGSETNRDPFVVSFLLPNGWTVERTGSLPDGYMELRVEDNPLKGTFYFLNEEGECVGTIGFSSYYMDFDPVKNYYQVYSGIVYGEYRFIIDRSYHPFYNAEASNISAITQTCYAPDDAPARFNPAVVSHDPERGVFVAAEFLNGGIEPIQLLDFAESIRIY